SAANTTYAPTMPSPTYESFMPIRLWAKSMPSASVMRPSITATDRRRNRRRARTYISTHISTPAMTPGTRHANACRPISTDAACPRARQGKGLVDAGVLAAGGDDRRDARAVGRQHGGVDRVVLDVADRDEPADLAVDVQRARDLAGVRVDEGHAPVRAGDDA